jgi:hypothetical protein
MFRISCCKYGRVSKSWIKIDRPPSWSKSRIRMETSAGIARPQLEYGAYMYSARSDRKLVR